MFEKDRSSNLPIGMEQIAERVHIRQSEVQELTFALTKEFKSTLRGARDFHNALAQSYLGELDYGYSVSPDEYRKVGFWRQNVFWGINYTFTEDQQTLEIERNIGDQKYETYRLQSRRFDDQMPVGGINVFINTYANDGKLGTVAIYKNDSVALLTTYQALKDFKAGR